MSTAAFTALIGIALILGATVLARADQGSPPRRWFVYACLLAMFGFAGMREITINTDTRAYASYAIQFRDSAVDEDAEVSDRLEWGFRVLLRGLGYVLPAGDANSYPRNVNLFFAGLGGVLLCRAVGPTGKHRGALVLIYMCSLFFVHQFATVRLGLALLFYLNYFLRPQARAGRIAGIVCLVFGCLLHSAVLILAVTLLAYEAGLRFVRKPALEVNSLCILLALAVTSGILMDTVAPLLFSGYRLLITQREVTDSAAISPKGLLEVACSFCLFLFHRRVAYWSYTRDIVRWRVLFYLTLVSFCLEAASGLAPAGRFRLLCGCCFWLQTVIISGGINFRKRTTWILLLVAAASVAAQVISISDSAGWSVITPASPTGLKP